MKHKHLFKWVAGATLLSIAGSAGACSVCIAHAIGAAVHAIGAQTLARGSTVVGVDFASFSKSQAGETSGTEESHWQGEYSLHIGHGLSDSTMLRLDIPYVAKRLSMTGEETMKTQGLGDIQIGLTHQLPTSPSSKHVIALLADLKLATGKNDLTDDAGDRMEEHSQIGTGSTDLVLGVLATTELKSGLGFAGLRYRANGANKHHYRYGNALFYNIGQSLKLDSASSFVIELNGRFVSKDKLEDGSRDENSGGHLGYLSFSYRRSLGKDYGLVGTYQLPVIRNLNGTQSETGLISLGVFKKL